MSSSESSETAIKATTPPLECGSGTKLEGNQCVVASQATIATEPLVATTEPTDPTTSTPVPETDPPRATIAPAATTSRDLDGDTVAFYKTSLGSLMCGYDFETARAVAKGEGTSLDSDSYHRICAGESVDGSPSAGSVQPYTVASADFVILLAPPLEAWMIQPSGPGFDAVMAAAQLLIDDPRPLPLLPTLAGGSVDSTLTVRGLTSYPGNDRAVYALADSLRILMPDLPLLLRDGSYTVGVEVPPGKYRTVGQVRDCYWETLDNTGDINDNNFVSAAPQVVMIVSSRDFAVNSDGCGPWVKFG